MGLSRQTRRVTVPVDRQWRVRIARSPTDAEYVLTHARPACVGSV